MRRERCPQRSEDKYKSTVAEAISLHGTKCVTLWRIISAAARSPTVIYSASHGKFLNILEKSADFW